MCNELMNPIIAVHTARRHGAMSLLNCSNFFGYPSMHEFYPANSVLTSRNFLHSRRHRTERGEGATTPVGDVLGQKVCEFWISTVIFKHPIVNHHCTFLEETSSTIIWTHIKMISRFPISATTRAFVIPKIPYSRHISASSTNTSNLLGKPQTVIFRFGGQYCIQGLPIHLIKPRRRPPQSALIDILNNYLGSCIELPSFYLT